MNFYININQLALVNISKLTGIDLDLKDAAILDFFVKFCNTGKMDKKLINNDIYYRLSYQWVIDKNPMLQITSRECIADRFTKLEKAGIITRYIDQEAGNLTYFAFAENYSKVIDHSEWAGEFKKSPLPAPDPTPIYIINKTNNINNKGFEKKEKNDAESVILPDPNLPEYTTEDHYTRECYKLDANIGYMAVGKQIRLYASDTTLARWRQTEQDFKKQKSIDWNKLKETYLQKSAKIEVQKSATFPI